MGLPHIVQLTKKTLSNYSKYFWVFLTLFNKCQILFFVFLQLTGFMNPLSKMVREKLAGLVGEGVSNVAEMRRHLRVFVDSVLFADMPKPDNMNVSYYPTDTTIRKHIYMSQMKLRYFSSDNINRVICYLILEKLKSSTNQLGYCK